MEKWIVYPLISMVFARLTSVVAKFGRKDMSSDSALVVRTAVVFALLRSLLFYSKMLSQKYENPFRGISG